MKNKTNSVLSTAMTHLSAFVIGLVICMSIYQLDSTYQPPDDAVTIASDTLFVRAAAIYTGNVDSRYVVTYESLVDAASSFVGCPVLMGHDWKDPNAAVGIIKEAMIKYDIKLNKYYLEMILEIKSAYAVNMIKKGLFSKLSIGFISERTLCPLDGKNMLFCEHTPGRYYKEGDVWRLARGIVKKFVGKEVSFINVPASEPARVLEWSHKPLTVNE